MKKIQLMALVGLLLGIAALVFNQRRLQHQVVELQTEQSRVAQELAEKKSPATEQAELEQTLARLQQTKLDLAVAEHRLTNMASRVAELDRQLTGLRNRVASGGRAPQALDTLFPGSLDTGAPAKGRSWGPEQAVGAPDTTQAGDIPTAWASRSPDGGEEWLKLGYERSVPLAEIHVRETYNPGAISKIVAVLDNGQEAVIWEGTEPPAEAPVNRVFQVPQNIYAKSVKVYLDTKRVPGWNEIDAVELVGRDGSRQWAADASASSTFAEAGGINNANNTPLLELR